MVFMITVIMILLTVMMLTNGNSVISDNTPWYANIVEVFAVYACYYNDRCAMPKKKMKKKKARQT